MKSAIGLTVAALGLQAFSVAAFAGPGGAAGSTFGTPAYQGDFPDPSILISGGIYWAYSTGSAGRNLQVMSSGDLHTWTPPVDPLPILPSWASLGRTWAPGVMQIGGRYVMYYTVRDTALATQCISVATSATPGGPFTDTSGGPLICQPADGGSIDPNPYLDPGSGRRYLFWKSDDNSIGRNSRLWGQPLSDDGLSLAAGTSPSLLLTESAAWQSPTVEGPTIVRNGSTYYLFYSANSYNTASSGIGYATSGSVLGAYTNRSRYGPWLGTTGNAEGPQGPMVFRDPAGITRLAFAAWSGPVGYQNGGARSLWQGRLTFNLTGSPTLS